MSTHTLPPEGLEVADAQPQADASNAVEETTGPQPYSGCLFPIFVTAKVPVETINRCLSRAAAWQEKWKFEDLWAAHLVQSASGPDPETLGPTYTVGESFSPPAEFLGKTAQELSKHFLEHWQVAEDEEVDFRLPQRSYILLDEQTLKDDTALLVTVSEDDDKELRTARSEFDCMVAALQQPDDRDNDREVDDKEFLGRERGVEDGIVVYRAEWMEKETAHQYTEYDYSDEEDEDEEDEEDEDDDGRDDDEEEEDEDEGDDGDVDNENQEVSVMQDAHEERRDELRKKLGDNQR